MPALLFCAGNLLERIKKRSVNVLSKDSSGDYTIVLLKPIKEYSEFDLTAQEMFILKMLTNSDT